MTVIRFSSASATMTPRLPHRYRHHSGMASASELHGFHHGALTLTRRRLSSLEEWAFSQTQDMLHKATLQTPHRRHQRARRANVRALQHSTNQSRCHTHLFLQRASLFTPFKASSETYPMRIHLPERQQDTPPSMQRSTAPQNATSSTPTHSHGNSLLRIPLPLRCGRTDIQQETRERRQLHIVASNATSATTRYHFTSKT